MPLQTEYYDFDDEQARLETEMQEIAEKEAEAEREEFRSRYRQRGTRLQRYRAGLKWADDEWTADGVELAGLAVGDVNLVQDLADENDAIRVRDCWVARGTLSEDLPYVLHDPSGVHKSDLQKSVGYIVDHLQVSFVRWAEERIHELTHPTDEGNEYRRLLAETQTEAT